MKSKNFKNFKKFKKRVCEKNEMEANFETGYWKNLQKLKKFKGEDENGSHF